MNYNIDENEISMAALKGLRSSFEQSIAAVDALGIDEKLFAFDFEKNGLLQEE